MQLFESDVEELKALLCVHVCGVVGGGECVCVCVCVYVCNRYMVLPIAVLMLYYKSN